MNPQQYLRAILYLCSSTLLIYVAAQDDGPYGLYAGTVAHGQYRIHKICGDKVSEIAAMLDFLNNTLPLAIDDARRTHSSKAYQTFFKDFTYASFVIDILTNITAGNPQHFGLGRMLSPMLICANKPGDFEWQGSERMKDLYSDSQCSIEGIYAAGVYISNMPFIAICPTFWKDDSPPVPTKSNCLGIYNRPPRFRATFAEERAIVYYQAYVLLHEILHFYVVAMAPSKGVADGQIVDEYRVNECFLLNAFKSSMNANNYVYYIENLRAHCKSFPTPRRIQVELLQVNASALSTTDSRSGALLNTTRSDVIHDIISDAQRVYVNNTLVWET